MRTKSLAWSMVAPLVLVSVSIAACEEPASTRDGLVDYDRDIRPIFAEHCFTCHGPDPASRAADLRLDTFEGATEVRADGAQAIVPRDPDASLVMHRIRSTEPGVRMPPVGTLSGDQIALVDRWIREGAIYDRHWAFRAPTRPPLPANGRANAVDAFVDDALATRGIDPSPSAAPATLLRRVTFDLTGLPPTIEEVDAFVADPSETAYLEVVERLLSSPRFAERAARDWLDHVGYGDSNGIYLDLEREMWAYRDWVIDAFLRNEPLDDFLVAQLAGDLLPGASDDDVLATAFLRQHPSTEEGGVDEEEYRIRYATDRAALVGTQLLGITVQCARCHDHKYDPIPQRDFYRLMACFDRVADRATEPHPTLEAPSPLQRQEIARWSSELATQREAFEALDLDPPLARWEASLGPVSWQPVTFSSMQSSAGSSLHQTADGTVDAGGGAPFADAYELTATSPPSTITAFQIELGTGRAATPQLSEIDVWLEGESTRRSVPLALAVLADGTPADEVIDGTTNTSLVVDAPSHLLLVPAVPIETRGEVLRLRIDQFTDAGAQFRSVRVLVSANAGASVPPDLRAVLAIPSRDRTSEETSALQRHFARLHADASTRAVAGALLLAEARVRELARAPSTRVMREDDPGRQTHVLDRGEFESPGEVVTCAAPLALTIDDPIEVANRLDLARWIVGPDHPTSARVLANHYFQLVFGRGIVATSGDFGARGTPPSHPELLDWLAVELVESGWDLRHLLRILVTSETYRRSSARRPDLADVDPDDLLMARVVPRRHDAEVLRDQALAVSGLLVEELGGRSVRPYHPTGLYESFTQGFGPLSVYRPDRDVRRVHRRALYTFWRRGMLLPSLALLDAPSRVEPVSRRSITNTPTQALALLHDPLFVEAARHLAERMEREGGADPDVQIAFAFRLVTARAPETEELRALRDAYDAELAEAELEPTAIGVLAIGESDRDSQGGVAAHRARTLVARTLLNLSETLTRE